LKVLCVVLLSSEHDDVPEFRSAVLTDITLVRTLTDNDFIVWGGDIRENEAYQASLKLGATTYPFVAFVSLHPVPTHLGSGSSRSGSGPRLTVLSRHEGPPATTTSATTLQAHITTSLLPRVTPLLSRLRSERWNRAQERSLRDEQDRAFEEAATKDKERVQAKQQAERQAIAEEQSRLAAQRDLTAQTERKAQWRRWARKHMVPSEPNAATDGGLRIGVLMPNGKRGIRRFASDGDAEDVYAFVESLLIPTTELEEEDPDVAPAGYSHEWSFTLATSFPRAEIPTKGVKLGTIEGLKGGANLVVEMKQAESAEGDDDSSDEDEDSSEE